MIESFDWKGSEAPSQTIAEARKVVAIAAEAEDDALREVLAILDRAQFVWTGPTCKNPAARGVRGQKIVFEVIKGIRAEVEALRDNPMPF